eukprot:9470323-Pyramimonas_sp.AAC.1
MKGMLEAVDCVESDTVFNMRSALGQQYYRKVQNDPLFKKELDEAPSEEAFKKKWVMQKYEGAKNKYKQYITSYQSDFEKKGKLVSFLRMCYEEGGPAGHLDETTVNVCRAICERCLGLGYPFAQIDDQGMSLKFLHFQLEYREVFTQRWEQVMKQSKEKAICDTPATEAPTAAPMKKKKSHVAEVVGQGPMKRKRRNKGKREVAADVRKKGKK